jgi:hypothetical protein
MRIARDKRRAFSDRSEWIVGHSYAGLTRAVRLTILLVARFPARPEQADPRDDDYTFRWTPSEFASDAASPVNGTGDSTADVTCPIIRSSHPKDRGDRMAALTSLVLR